jgi:hypothetical protein
MGNVPDFTENELWLIRTTLRERYGRDVDLELADVEVRVPPGARELTSCPAAFWAERGAHFVIVKTGEGCYRAQFYYRLHQMYGTGVEEFDDLVDCAVTVLRVQADHEASGAVG